MPSVQKLYQGRPTAKLTLFALWDDGWDDTNANIVEEFGVSRSTVRSYRVEWKAKHGRGVKALKKIVRVDPDDVPFETAKGIVWRVPLEEKLKCDRCPYQKECKWWVVRGGYLGCEEVFEDELLPDTGDGNQDSSGPAGQG